MSEIPLQQQLQEAISLHQAGDFQGALQRYNRILNDHPNQPDTLYLAGTALFQAGDTAQSLKFLEESVKVSPDNPDAFNNLAGLYKHLKREEEAIIAYRKAIAIKPDYADALNNLALTLNQLGRGEEALPVYETLVTLAPSHALAFLNLGGIYIDMGRIEEGEAALRRAIEIKPDFADACNNLGIFLIMRGRHEEAEAFLRQAIEINPAHGDALCNLGVVLKDQGKLEEAETTLLKALEAAPENAPALNNLATVYTALGEAQKCADSFHKASELDRGKIDYLSGYLNALLLLPDTDNESLFKAAGEMERYFGQPLAAAHHPHTNDRTANRPLKIGYFSGYLLPGHSLMRQILPIFKAHDRSRFHLTIYGNAPYDAPENAELREVVDACQVTTGMSDETVAEMIRNDGIDILICLIGHTSGDRMGVFALKAAPIQVNFHGMMTTGLSAMDYWITDETLHPENTTERFFEELVHLPSLFAFAPLEGAPEINPAGGHPLTFGCFNQAVKINNGVLDAWAEIMKQLPDSRLFLKTGAYSEPTIREKMTTALAERGVDPARITMEPQTGDYAAHLAYYDEVDIALDSFPYSGCHTTYESLWMGVPVVTLAGERFIGRMTASILHSVGLDDLICSERAEYVETAVALAGDREKLNHLRQDLRQRIAASPLCDAATLTRNLEDAYQKMWAKWVEGQS